MKKIYALVLTLVVRVFFEGNVFAQTTPSPSDSEFGGVIPKSGTGQTGELGERIASGNVSLQDMSLVIIYLIDLVTKLAGTVAVVFILYAGFQLISSGLNESAREEAKNTLQYAVIGLVVCLLAWVIVNVVQMQLTTATAV
ncbi:pilin [Candidatus Gracilibacteria bacterium]|nr:pilin [Candidatus Gracilibacteria bacterium]